MQQSNLSNPSGNSSKTPISGKDSRNMYSNMKQDDKNSLGYQLSDGLDQDDAIQTNYTNFNNHSTISNPPANKMISNKSQSNQNNNSSIIVFNDKKSRSINMSQNNLHLVQGSISDKSCSIQKNTNKSNSRKMSDNLCLDENLILEDPVDSSSTVPASRSLPKKQFSNNQRPIGKLFCSVKKLEQMRNKNKKIKNKRKITKLQKRIIKPSDSKINKMKKELFRKKKRGISNFRHNHLITKCTECDVIMKKDDFYSHKQNTWMYSVTKNLRVNDRNNIKILCDECSKLKQNVKTKKQKKFQAELKKKLIESDLQEEESFFFNLIDKSFSNEDTDDKKKILPNDETKINGSNISPQSNLSEECFKNKIIMNQIQFSVEESNNISKIKHVSPKKELLSCFSVRGTEYMNLYIDESSKLQFKNDSLNKIIPHNCDEDCDTDDETLVVAINKTFSDLIKGIKKMKKKQNKKQYLHTKFNLIN